MRLTLLLTLCACANGEDAVKPCAGADVAFVMRTYNYVARLRCVDGRAVAKSNKITTGIRRDNCYEDRLLIKCEDDPKWTELTFAQHADEPPPPLGFLLISEPGYTEYKLADADVARGGWLDALRHAEIAAASDPNIAMLVRLRALILAKLGRLPLAQAAYERAITLAPGALVYRLELAGVLTASHDQAAALATLEGIARDAPKTWPRLPEVWCLLARAESDARAAAADKRRACEAGFLACCG